MRYLLMTLLVLLFNGCKENDLIKIPLKQVVNNDIAFETSISTFPFMFYNNKYKDFYADQLKKYSLLPNVDVQYIASSIPDGRNFIYQLKLRNQITDVQYQKLKEQTSLNPEIESKKKGLIPENILVGIKNDKIFIVYDVNKNFDFNDDPIEFFELTNNESTANYSKKLPDLPLFEMNQSYYINDSLEKYSRKIKILPNRDYFAFQMVKDTSLKKLGVVGYFQDYYSGELNLGSSSYEIAIQGFDRINPQILIKPKNNTLKFHDDDESFNYNFSYKLQDTLVLNHDQYVLSHLGASFQSLTLKKINPVNKDFTRGRIGEKIKNYNIKSIFGDDMTIIQSSGKEFTLLEFWGTWCGPCKEMTPKIVALEKEFSNKLDVIGFANDKSSEIVQEYIMENSMNWKQVLVNDKQNHTILKEFDIRAYPTFILINNEREVLYRGSFPSSLEEIRTIVANKKE